jgi:hypothetical protein
VFGFTHAGGDAQFLFTSKTPFESLPALQDITAAVEMFDGSGGDVYADRYFCGAHDRDAGRLKEVNQSILK